MNRLVENASSPEKFQPRRGCTSATLHRRYRLQSWRNAFFMRAQCFLPSFANLRYAVFCQDSMFSFSFMPLGLNSSVENVKPPKKINLGEVAHLLRHAVFCQNQRFRPHFFQAFRSEPIGRKRQPPPKNINLGEVAHLPQIVQKNKSTAYSWICTHFTC